MKKGEIMSPEQRLKVSLSRKGKGIGNTNGFKKGHNFGNTNGFKKGQVGPRKGVIVSAESKLKMSLAKKGRQSSFKGKKMSLESRKRVSDSRRNYLLKVNPDYQYGLNTKKEIRLMRIKK